MIKLYVYLFQRSIQNFPDYVKYVAKKSKAGFDKVHEELHRIYWGNSDKVSPSLDQKEQCMPPMDTDLATTHTHSKLSLRKRWSVRLWSTSESTLPVGESFTSYIPEGDELDSMTSSSEYDIVLSDEIEQAKSRTCGTHKDVPHSASVIEKHKTRFNFDKFRHSMPYSEHIKEAIYTNDRVVKVEESHVEEDINHDYDSPTSLYSIPIPKCKRQKSYEINDYVNLRSPHAELDDDKNHYVLTDPNLTWPCSTHVTVCSDKTTASKMVSSSNVPSEPKRQKEDADDAGDVDDEHYYLPPTIWTQSENKNPKKQNSTLSTMRKQPANNYTLSGNAMNQHYGRMNFNNGDIGSDNSVAVEDDDYYTHPTEWFQPDFKNTPNVHNNANSPTKTGKLDKMSNLLTDDIYTKMNQNTKENPANNADYCVPNNQWTQSANNQDSVGINHYMNIGDVVVAKKSEYMNSELGILNADKIDSGLRGEDEFYNYSVDEVVECFNECALIELATLCKMEQMNGKYFRGLTADDFKNKPFLLSLFYISKLQKVISGWRPKLHKQ